MKQHVGVGTILWAALSFTTLPAFASLGGSLATVNDDATTESVTATKTASFALYDVYQIKTAKAEVREFVSNDKAQVFAVIWTKGKGHIDLKQYLGQTNFKAYMQAERKTPVKPGRLPRRIEVGNLTVITAGHMNSVTGKAYISDLVPPGLDINTIQ